MSPTLADKGPLTSLLKYRWPIKLTNIVNNRPNS